jgi:hypothetical protein
MDDLELLKQLGQLAGADAVPSIDVSARVIRQIARGRQPAQSRRSLFDPRLSLISIGACALSVVAIVFTWSAQRNNDSLAALSEAAATNTGPEALLSVLEP